MEVFRELIVYVSEEQNQEFMNNLETRLSDGWSSDVEENERLRTSGYIYYCFNCTENDSRPAARLVFIRRNENEISVTNIIPPNVGEIIMGEYNGIIEEFYDKFVKPVSDEMGIVTHLSTKEQTLDDWMPSDCAIKLRTFSSTTNRSTGSSHPCDRERWFDFLVSVFNVDENFGAEELGRWLIEEDNWSEDRAYDLVIEYEFAISLLKYYDRPE